MNQQHLDFLIDTFYKTQNICSWTLDSKYNLLYSNCPEKEFFFNLFSVGTCPNIIEQHFKESMLPLLVTDNIGFVWVSVFTPLPQENTFQIYLLGPMFTSEMTLNYLSRRFRKLHLPPDILSRVMHYLKDTPTVSPNTAASYASMLYYALNGTSIHLSDVILLHENNQVQQPSAWGEANWHGTWLEEQQLINNIKEGRIDTSIQTHTGSIGRIGGGDPLRQAKNEIIVYLVLCSRASILGGVSYEGAMILSDYFIQVIEDCETVSQVYNIGAQIQQTYVQRVQEVKSHQNYSSVVSECMEYVETHINEKNRLSDIAKSIGYTEYYISRCFKKETGDSLTNYIITKKIDLAKTYLEYSTISVAELSDYLSFSSPSHFISTFKRITGISPNTYKKKKRQ
ncbi:MAG: helix-turn-helix domain-containing protein [Lachnospiraceae bacterium]|nr:helix-turn-helix domain-containing protein [Lachnospiraceae bacterium]